MQYYIRVCKDFGATVWPVMHVIEVAKVGWSIIFLSAGCKTACLLPCEDLRTSLGCSCNCAWHSPKIPHTDGSPCKACFLKYMPMWFVSVCGCVWACTLHVTGQDLCSNRKFPKPYISYSPKKKPKPKTVNCKPKNPIPQ